MYKLSLGKKKIMQGQRKNATTAQQVTRILEWSVILDSPLFIYHHEIVYFLLRVVFSGLCFTNMNYVQGQKWSKNTEIIVGIDVNIFFSFVCSFLKNYCGKRQVNFTISAIQYIHRIVLPSLVSGSGTFSSPQQQPLCP